MDLKLLEVLKRLIKKEDLLLSLYAGNGIIESELDNDTIALEVESWHVEDANRNALQNGMMNKMFAKLSKKFVQNTNWKFLMKIYKNPSSNHLFLQLSLLVTMLLLPLKQ